MKAEVIYADKTYYLIDSLVLENLSAIDQQLIDTSLKFYYEVKHDTSRLTHIGRIITNCHHTPTWVKYNAFMQKVAKQHLEEDLPEAVRKKFTVFLGSTFINQGAFENINGNVNEALNYYNLASETYTSVNHLQGIASAMNNIGYVFNDIGDIPNALAAFHESLIIKEKIGHKIGIVTALNNIAFMYEHQDEAAKALEAYNQALKLSEEIKDENGIADILSNIGYLYGQQNEYEKAHEYYARALKMDSLTGNLSGVASSLNNIGRILKRKGEKEKAMSHYLKSLAIRDSMNNQRAATSVLINIADLEMENGDRPGAILHANQSLELAQELGYPDRISGAASLLSEIYKISKNYSMALDMYELHISMRDSINNEETQKATIRQQTKYEFEKMQLVKDQREKDQKRKAKEARQRRDNLQYSVILLGLLVLGSLVMGLGKLSLSTRMAEGLIFFSFLILFEFLLVLADPYLEGWSGGAPGIKLLFNAGIAALIFPLHAFFETKLKGRLVKNPGNEIHENV